MVYGGTAHPPATERAGPDKPPPTDARASALPDRDVIEGAGRPNADFTKLAKRAGWAARAFIVISAALAVVNVLNAENKLEAILRETAKVDGGIAAGGAAIGAAGFNPLTTLIGAIAGGAAGAYGVEIGFDEIMEYLN